MNQARAIAFYLPQYHPVPVNDKFWGTGFTEWTNVTRAKPLFLGHYQPDLPGDLSFYDLRVPEVRSQQAELARNAGISGFCYWHYWFGNGVRVLERIFDEVLRTGNPDFPFMLGWANDSWTGKWYGLDDQVLLQQNYLGEADEIRHFNELLPAFRDSRYMKVEGKPIFLVFKPNQLPDPKSFTSRWNQLAVEAGFPGIHFISHLGSWWDFKAAGFNGYIPESPGDAFGYADQTATIGKRKRVAHEMQRRINRLLHREAIKSPRSAYYRDYVSAYPTSPMEEGEYPIILPNWDNTPRSGERGWVLLEPDAYLFSTLLQKAIDSLSNKPPDHRLLFLKSWNEWAEGNYLEPSVRHGHSYLEALSKHLRPPL
ncbi:MAG: glycoside hydrolase family 99-like domain-containing protein [Cyanobacteria bacterium]|nr:glycoside hydrolase family 99-like domain-containing protein [Cyanobacteriota bacterium]